MKTRTGAIGFLLLMLTNTAYGQPSITKMNSLFTPVDVTANIDDLPSSERGALAKLLDAARIIDAIFLEQVWAGNPALLLQMQSDRTVVGQAALDFFVINKGPWSRLEENDAFVAGVPAKPRGASYYPPDSTREEVATWIDSLSDVERRIATGFFTTIRRNIDGYLYAVPYSHEYQTALTLASTHLQDAAALTSNPSLKRYLLSRAVAFASNDYYDSDVAWMELDSKIEPTIGPYEVYEDQWFNYKAAFEAFITIKDEADTVQLSRFSDELQELENNLPISPEYRNPQLGTMAPIRVVNVVFTAGDANSGVQTAAFNLPNDERVVRDKGSKRVMLKNIQQAKFEHVLTPIAAIALSSGEQTDVSFEAFFTHILMHELMHGLGPHSLNTDKRSTTVREALKETYSTIEEAKADISGLWALHRLIDKGVINDSLERSIYTTFLASTFRSIRFGIDEAHGRGVAIQLNSFLDAGAVVITSDGTFAVNHTRIRPAVQALTTRLLTIQAEGNYEEAQTVLKTLGLIRPDVQSVLNRLDGIPIDIQPRYRTAELLINERYRDH